MQFPHGKAVAHILAAAGYQRVCPVCFIRAVLFHSHISRRVHTVYSAAVNAGQQARINICNGGAAAVHPGSDIQCPRTVRITVSNHTTALIFVAHTAEPFPHISCGIRGEVHRKILDGPGVAITDAAGVSLPVYPQSQIQIQHNIADRPVIVGYKASVTAKTYFVFHTRYRLVEDQIFQNAAAPDHVKNIGIAVGYPLGQAVPLEIDMSHKGIIAVSVIYPLVVPQSDIGCHHKVSRRVTHGLCHLRPVMDHLQHLIRPESDRIQFYLLAMVHDIQFQRKGLIRRPEEGDQAA